MTSAALSRLEKRIDSLEAGTSAFEDPILVMLDALTDNELGVLEEYNSLQKCGYGESEIEKMMPNYSMVFDIAAKMKAMKVGGTRQEEKPAKRKIKAKRVVIDHNDLYAADNEEPADE